MYPAPPVINIDLFSLMTPIVSLAANTVEDFEKAFQLRRNIKGLVTNKKTEVVDDIGIRDVADRFVVIVLDHVMAKNAAGGDDTVADTGLTHSCLYPCTVRSALGIENNGEAERGTHTIFTEH